MRFALAFAVLAMTRPACAEQDAGIVTELAPIVVSGNFQLQLETPQPSEHAVQSLAQTIRGKEAKDEGRTRDGIFAAKFWRYLPKFGIAPEADFFVPSYSAVAYRKSELQLRASEKNALITR